MHMTIRGAVVAFWILALGAIPTLADEGGLTPEAQESINRIAIYSLIGLILLSAAGMMLHTSWIEPRRARRKREKLLAELKDPDPDVRLAAIGRVELAKSSVQDTRSALQAGFSIDDLQGEHADLISALVDMLGPIVQGDTDAAVRRAAAKRLRHIGQGEIPRYKVALVSASLDQARQRLAKAANVRLEEENEGTRLDSADEAIGWYWKAEETRTGPRPPFVLYEFQSGDDAQNSLLALPCIAFAVDSRRLVCTLPLTFGSYETGEHRWEAVLGGSPLAHDLWLQAREAFVGHRGTCKKELEPRTTLMNLKPSPATFWQTITGAAAIALAAKERVARPGTFSAVAVRWSGDNEPPTIVSMAGGVKCGYCGGTTRFDLEGMSGEVRCEQCGSAYSLFSPAVEIDGKQGRVLVASVYSHRQGTGIILPQIELAVVSSGPTGVRAHTDKRGPKWSCEYCGEESPSDVDECTVCRGLRPKPDGSAS